MPYVPADGWRSEIERAERDAERAIADVDMMAQAGAVIEERLDALARAEAALLAAMDRAPMLCHALISVPTIAVGAVPTLTGAWDRRPTAAPVAGTGAVIAQGIAAGAVRITGMTLVGCTVTVTGPVTVTTGLVHVIASGWSP